MTEGSQTTSDVQTCMESLTVEDFLKAVEALKKANVPGPLKAIINTDGWTEEQWKICEMMEEMANAPKEEYGKRYPGERCAYEGL